MSDKRRPKRSISLPAVSEPPASKRQRTDSVIPSNSPVITPMQSSSSISGVIQRHFTDNAIGNGRSIATPLPSSPPSKPDTTVDASGSSKNNVMSLLEENLSASEREKSSERIGRADREPRSDRMEIPATNSPEQVDALGSDDQSPNKKNEEPIRNICMPIAIKRLPPIENAVIPADPEKFTKIQIEKLLGGAELANNFWQVTHSTGGILSAVKGYFLIDVGVQVFAPRSPGQHGAIVSSDLVPTYRLEREEHPLFISDGWRHADGSPLYIYCGHYTEPRSSDIIGWNEMAIMIPGKIKEFHARDLSQKQGGKKKKAAIRALKGQWLMHTLGWWNEETQIIVPFAVDKAKLANAKRFEKEILAIKLITDKEANAISYEDIMQALERPEGLEGPSFRLYWKYLQAVRFDNVFYELLKEHKKNLYVASSPAEAPTPGAGRTPPGGNGDMEARECPEVDSQEENHSNRKHNLEASKSP